MQDFAVHRVMELAEIAKILQKACPQGGESRGLNGRVPVISCRYSDKTCKKINYISTNTYSIILQKNAHTSSL